MRRLNFTNTQVASSETARDINRGVVLNLIRRRQPISRADLARVSGLQRSTVSVITEQLIQEQWVINGPTGRLPRGRRPTFLRLNERRVILVADVRPEHTTVAVADVNGRFLSQESVPTARDPRTAASTLVSRFKHLMKSHHDLRFEGIGISLPGRVNQVNRRVVFAPNLKWRDFDFHAAIEAGTGVRVELENAANACVLAEVWFGNRERVRDLVVLTVSEGIGIGLFVNGHLATGLNGMAGEFGHVPLDPEGPACACGSRGCWEVFASNRAALRYYHESRPEKECTSFQGLLARAEAGDGAAVRALEKMAHAIGRGLRMIVAGVAPEEIVVVGELTRQWQRFGWVIQEKVAAGALVGDPPRLRPAEGSMARLRGAVALVLQKHFGPGVLASEERKTSALAKSAVAAN
jgi:predicted NBD/HSP70 family sugar kinase